MSDRRDTANPEYATGRIPAVIAAPVVDLCASPGGPRDRQLLLGAHVTHLGTADGWAYIRATSDGYHGFVPNTAIGAEIAPTHRVAAPSTHAYSAPDIKSAEGMTLSFGCRVVATGQTGSFWETPQGFIPAQHLRPVASTEPSPHAVAALFLGTPYLWGGNSRAGIDCSGLVQAALLACGHDCPGDSDQQMASVGQELPPDTPLRCNDLIFWKGHVALVHDRHTLIHANAHHMATVLEPIEDAIARIERQGDGPVLARRRP